MVVSRDGDVAGSVSGGCVEGAVFEEAQAVLAHGAPVRVEYGISDEEALGVGLTCGGRIEVFLSPLCAVFSPLADALDNERPVALVTVVAAADPTVVGRTLLVAPDETHGTIGGPELDAAVTADARGLLAQGRTTRRRYGPNGDRRGDHLTVFIESFTPPPRMLIFGASDYASEVSRIGVFLGYRVTVCDPRPVFTTTRRFPDAHDVVVEWPHRYLERTSVDERTAVCVLTHDPKFDVPLLEIALRSDAGYIGALGSRRMHADRLRRLRERGLTGDELARLRSPIGLDLGARTPQGTAVSIAAEIIQLRSGGTGRPLSETWGPIHRDAPEAAMLTP